MASACSLSFFSSLLFYTLFFDCTQGSSVRAESRDYSVSISSLLPGTTAVCSKAKALGRSALTVTHLHGPCSSVGNEKAEAAAAASLDEVLAQDQSRVRWIRSKISRTSRQLQPQGLLAESRIPVHSGRSFSTGNFVVTVGYGTPRKDMTVVFDTGSDLTWIQCEPCAVSCYPQQEKIFDPSQSTTYSNVSCNSNECSQLNSATGNNPGCSSSTCVYSVSYGDQSYSIGFFSRDTLTVDPSAVFANFPFGCGQRNRGLFGSTAGLLGLGRDRLSFPSQTARTYGNRFSYCLPSSPSSTGYLAFGGYHLSPKLKFTPLVTDRNSPSFYFLDLIAINVGGRKLAIQPSVFSRAGTIIDSGTVITRLPPSAYAILRSEFSKGMSKYPSAQPLSILDTCFDLSNYTSIAVPKIELVFLGGAQMDVPVTGILLGSGPSQICLAFAGNTDPTDYAIIGNKQQQTLDVVYDVAGGRIGFGAGGCS